MPKHIVFCADGTWNGPGQQGSPKDDPPSNVFKLYLSLAGDDAVDSQVYRSANEQERLLRDADGQLLQVAKYLHGVGDGDNKLVQLIGGATGAGLITRIIRGYTYLSRQYRPGDAIHLVGFSRGAYTARALAGLVNARGLLDATTQDLQDKDEAYRLGSAVWADYRREVCSRPGSEVTRMMRFERLLDELPGFFSRASRDIVRVPSVPIHTVAVWDTVGAMGIPEFSAAAAKLDDFRFTDTQLGRCVQRAFHAVAIDEQRVDFSPTLWDDDPRVTQLLFPGAHSDVGGGYPTEGGESGLSDGALQWMTERLTEQGVRFKDTPPMPVRPDALGPSHGPWDQLPWRVLRQPDVRDGLQRESLRCHASVVQRWGQQVVLESEAKKRGVYAPTHIRPPADGPTPRG